MNIGGISNGYAYGAGYAGNVQSSASGAVNMGVAAVQSAGRPTEAGTAATAGRLGIDGQKNGTTGRVAPTECQTCKERKYQDGSDENVSFKAAAHIAPGAAGAVVRAHEGEHVSNAYTKAAEKGGKVINASVSIHTSVCPECGRTYVSGGTTRTMIQYPNETNPYQQERKAQDAMFLRGRNVDIAI
ncbi:MAG: hypothetical protein IJY09_06790 [Lachnospiraceae bacterium]|nr:hypothetical protein [Lachnospiraceae bacterium]